MDRPFKKLVAALAIAASSLTMYARAGAAQTAAVDPVTTKADANPETTALLHNFTRKLAEAPFTVLGNSNHRQPLIEFFDYGNVLDAIQKSGKKYIGLEDVTIAQGIVDRLAAGKIDQDQYVTLRTAQMKAKGIYSLYDLNLRQQADFIVAARERDMGVIMVESSPGDAKIMKDFQKQLKQDYKAYVKDGHDINFEDFAKKEEQPLIAATQEKIYDIRTTPEVNEALLANMVRGVTAAERKAGRESAIDQNDVPPFMMFVGVAHAEPLQGAGAKKSIASNVIYLFQGEEDVTALSRSWSARSETWQIPPEVQNYIVLDSLRWHEAPVSTANPALAPTPKLQFRR